MLARLFAEGIINKIYDANRTPQPLRKEVNEWLEKLGHSELVF